MGYRLKELREKVFPGHGGQTECAEKLGVSRQQYNNWESGRRNPNRKYLKALAKLFGVSINDLVRKEGAETGNQSSARDMNPYPLAVPSAGSNKDIMVPVSGDAAAATNGEDSFYLDSLAETMTIPKGTCMIRIRGRSMEPMAHDGQHVFLCPMWREPNKGDLVVVWNNDIEEYRSWFKKWVGKRKRQDGGQEVVLKSVNDGEGIDAEVTVAEEDFGGVRVISGVWYE